MIVDKELLLNLYKQGAKNQVELSIMFGVTKSAINQIIKFHLSPKERKSAIALYKLKKLTNETL